jgi:hypothetical protein
MRWKAGGERFEFMVATNAPAETVFRVYGTIVHHAAVNPVRRLDAGWSQYAYPTKNRQIL